MTTPITVALGGGWKMTLTRADQYRGNPAHEATMDTWCGLARTDLSSVIIYEDFEEGEDGMKLIEHPDSALAEVIFESRWNYAGGQWSLEYPGRTFYAGCPGSGKGGDNETALFEIIPLYSVLQNIFTLSRLALKGEPIEN